VRDRILEDSHHVIIEVNDSNQTGLRRRTRTDREEIVSAEKKYGKQKQEDFYWISTVCHILTMTKHLTLL
jgi:hypothetical protein